MKRLVALGVFVILSAELVALSLHDRRFVLWAAGAAALFALVSARQLLGDVEPPPAAAVALSERFSPAVNRRSPRSTATPWASASP